MTRHFLNTRPSRIDSRGRERTATHFKYLESAGFTLIETLVAVSLLSVAIVAPMTLTAKSLASAYYARDQITAFYLAQEAIEALRSIRDSQILQISQSPSGASINIFGPLVEKGLTNGAPFTIDARLNDPVQAIAPCSGTCSPLQTNGTLYGHDPAWAPTYFTRTVRASFVGGGQDEVRITVTVTWQTGAFQIRTFSISEDLYRWVNDGSSQE